MSVSYSINSVTVTDCAPTATFTVTRKADPGEDPGVTTVDFATADVSAVAGTDYTATSGSLTFQAGVTEQSIVVAIADAAYDNAATTTFLVTLDGYGAASGSIQPNSARSGQIYFYVPDRGNSVTVPTESAITDDTNSKTTSDKTEPPNYQNIKYQTDYSGFTDPKDPKVDMPRAYIRFGYAGADMNSYERVIANTDTYIPKWAGYEDDGRPDEIGTLSFLMVPRGIDRKGKGKKKVDAAKVANAHLDGVFLYSNNNYTITVKNNLNQVIQGDYVHYVHGRSGQLYMGPESKWTYYDGPLRSATGFDSMYGKLWQYDISSNRKLTIEAGQTVNYGLDLKFSANAGAQIETFYGYKYSVANSVEFTVKGVQAAGNCDILGNFAIEVPLNGYTSTKTSFNQSVSESLVLSVDSGLSTAWTYPVVGVAGMNAAAASGATVPSWISQFASNGYFFENVTDQGLKKSYGEAFSMDLPIAMGSLAVVTATVVLLAGVMQKKAQVAPSLMPKISMTPTGLTLSCGENSISLTDEGIFLLGDAVTLDAGVVEIESEGVFNLTGPEITAEAETFNVMGNLDVLENLEVTADADVFGNLTATFVES